MMKGNRSPSKFLISQYKAAGYNQIIPSCSVRFVRKLLPQLPNDWQELDREGLIKKVRHYCELRASTGELKRQRSKETQGYVYQIIE